MESLLSPTDSSPIRNAHKVLPKLSPIFFLKYHNILIKLKEHAFTKRLKRLRVKSQSATTAPALDIHVFQLFEDFCGALFENDSLEDLNFSGVSMSALMFSRLMQALSQHSKLKTLNFGLTDLSNLSLKYICRTLKENTSITRLNLFSVDIHRENLRDLTELLIYNKNLEEINLNFCELGPENLKDYCEGLVKSRKIVKIKLAKNGFEKNGLKALGFFLKKTRSCKKIKKLDLSYNKLGAAELRILEGYINKNNCLNRLKKNKNYDFIDNLKLNSNKIKGSETIQLLNEIVKGLDKLQKLGLSKNGLENNDLVELAPCFQRVYRKVDVSRNNLDDEIGDLEFFKNLKILDISYNRLGKDACEKIANFLRKSENIEVLDLSNNIIRSQGFEKLCQGLCLNKTLKTLKVSRNEIEKIKIFQDLKEKLSIKRLELSGNPLDLEALECLFQEKKPNLLEEIALDDMNLGELLRKSQNSSNCQKNLRKNPALTIEKETNFPDSSPKTNKSGLIKLVFIENSEIFENKLSTTLNFANLQSLSLEKSPLFLTPLLKAIKKNYQNTTLLKLDLSYCSSLTNKDYKNLSFLIENLSNLQHLCLNNISLGNLTDIYLEILLNSLAKSPRLRILELNNNNLKVNFPNFLSSLQKTPNLTDLSLRHNYFPNEFYESLGDFVTKASHLVQLDLSENCLGYLTVASLCDSLRSACSNLSHLYLRNTGLNITCLYPISRLISKNLNIKVLDLSLNDFLQKDLNTLFFQQKSEGITEIDLSSYCIDNYQGNNLVKFLKKTSILQSIKLRDTSFQPGDLVRILKYLAEVPSVRSLEFVNINLVDQEISKFLMRLRRNKSDVKSLSLQELDNFKEKACSSLAKFIGESSGIETLEIRAISDILIGLDAILAQIPGKKDFVKLVLNNIGLDKKHVEGLCEAFRNKEFKELVLDENRLDMGDFQEILEKLKMKGGNLRVLSINGNNLIRNTWNLQLFEDLETSRIQELKLSNSLHNINIDTLRSFCKSIGNNQFLRSPELDNNGFSDENVITLSEIFKGNTKIKNFSMQANNFSSLGLESFFKSLHNNKSLESLNIANNLTAKDEPFFCHFLGILFSHNTTLKFLDISNTNLTKLYNKAFLSILMSNSQIFFVNTHWKGLKTPLALKILERLISKYFEYNGNHLAIPDRLKCLNFSESRLDDEFCLNFAEFLLGVENLEILDISKNPKITLIGLKFIYVSLANLHKMPKNCIKTVKFEACNHRNLLNDGLATAMVEWSRYRETDNRCYKAFFSFIDCLFSKMMVRANRFLYGSDFEDFQLIFNKNRIIGLILCNFLLVVLLSFLLPIILTLSQHSNYSFMAFFLYSVFSVGLELIFWKISKKSLNKVAIIERDWQREILINDFLNLVSGALARYDFYSDTVFVLITLCHGFRKIFIASIALLLLKVFFKSIQFFKSFVKLLMAVKRGKSSMRIWNLIAKLAVICDFILIGDILDRYCPGNAKKVKRILFVKLAEPKFISMGFLSIVMKFFLEDIPQTVVQIIYFSIKDDKTYENKEWQQEVSGFCLMSNSIKTPISDTDLENLWLTFNITRLIISLFVSFYTFASIRQSYLEQSDFDERLESHKLLLNSSEDEENTYRKSFMKQNINTIHCNENMNKSIKDRMTLITSKYLENFVKKNKENDIYKIKINRNEEGIEDFKNLAVNSLESQEIGNDFDFMDSRARLKKYLQDEAL